MTATILDRPGVLPEQADDLLYEVIDGRRVGKVVGIRQILLANRLAFFLNRLAFARGLGFAVVEALLDLGNPGSRQYRPDLAFVSEERWPRDRMAPPTDAWAVVPDLAVEVVNTTISGNELEGKIVYYLKAGVRLVWVIYPSSGRVHVYDGSSKIRIVKLGEELDGGAVVPGFRLPLATLFGAEVAPA